MVEVVETIKKLHTQDHSGAYVSFSLFSFMSIITLHLLLV